MEAQSQREAVVADVHDGAVSIEIKESDERESSSRSSNKWLNSIMNVGDESKSSKSHKPKIQKVHPMLREVESNKNCYDPWVVSIGPCHHGKPELESVERFKITLARDYVKNSKATIEELYREVIKVAGDARKCYAEGLTEQFDDEAFAQMMFLDGCFILQYIYSIVTGKPTDLLVIDHQAALVRRDLFLLENQLPFVVLKVLMSVRFGNHEGENMITLFIKHIRGVTSGGKSAERVGLKDRIKNFFRENIWGARSHPDDQMLSRRSYEDECTHLLDILRRQYIDPHAFTFGCYITGGWYNRHSAKDFKKVGIHFKPSKTYKFTDIVFQPEDSIGILTLPPIIIDDTTKSMLSNLAAYEACPDNANEFEVTSYICFMESVIDDAEDVMELRSRDILINYLGSDKQVADIFNEIATKLVASPHAYAEVKTKIEAHHRDRRKIWMAKLRHSYFRGPWTFINAALFAIALSVSQTALGAIQTYLTAYPPKKD